MPRLRYTNGSAVEVPDEKVDGLLRSGFTAVEEKKSATTSRKSSSSKSDK